MKNPITLFKLSCIVSDIETISGHTLDALVFSNTYYIINTSVAQKRDYTNRVNHMMYDAEAAFVVEYDRIRIVKNLRDGGLANIFEKYGLVNDTVDIYG